jgi:hypothetical protein
MNIGNGKEQTYCSEQLSMSLLLVLLLKQRVPVTITRDSNKRHGDVIVMSPKYKEQRVILLIDMVSSLQNSFFLLYHQHALLHQNELRVDVVLLSYVMHRSVRVGLTVPVLIAMIGLRYRKCCRYSYSYMFTEYAEYGGRVVPMIRIHPTGTANDIRSASTALGFALEIPTVVVTKVPLSDFGNCLKIVWRSKHLTSLGIQ